MSWWEAAVLGVVQGVTEFLPVSSSAHLVLGQALLGVRSPGVVYEAAVHLATLVAVLWVYRRRVVELTAGMARGDGASWAYVGLLALASVPAAVVGLWFRQPIEAAFQQPTVAAGLLLVTGLLVASIRITAAGAGKERPGVGGALWIGFAQAAAILPGISRSGSTVAVGVWRGVEPARMAEFSFLLSVPAVGGAAFMQLGPGQIGLVRSLAPELAVGFVAAATSGVLAIHLFVRALEAGSFHRFAYYCWMVGGGYLLAAWLWPGLRG